MLLLVAPTSLFACAKKVTNLPAGPKDSPKESFDLWSRQGSTADFPACVPSGREKVVTDHLPSYALLPVWKIVFN
jgi:hypothetical protein